MPIGVRDPLQHLNSHELHRAGATACATAPASELLGEVQVDQHSRDSGLFWVRYDDVILGNVAVQDVALDV